MGGNHHKLAMIDLSGGKIDTIDPGPEAYRRYMGGSALAARLFLDTPGPSAAPLAAESPLFVMTGPLVGTTFPGSSRFVMAARSPLTGIWGESTSGGAFGAELKKAGWDGLQLTGKSRTPVYILIENGEISLRDAAHLWGRDTYDAVDAIKAAHSDKFKVLAIGPAGENMVGFASVCNDKAHHFGRTGMGAVLGSKNVKALAVKGTGRTPLADEAAYKAVRDRTVTEIRESMICDSFHDLGTAAAMDMGMLTGDVPIRNWALGEAEDIQMAIGGVALEESYLTGHDFCFACPIGCKPVVTVDDEKYPAAKSPGPEYETLASFGTMIMNGNLAAAIRANEVCNRLGLDTITCGSTVAYVMEAYEKGLLSSADMDGLTPEWGDMDAALALVEKIARRDGFGDRAAAGSAALAASLGAGAQDFCVAVKGLEMPMHDPRAFHGIGLAYMMSNRGACHLQHSDQAVEQGMVSWTELGLRDDWVGMTSDDKGEMVFISENIGQIANAACFCHFVHWAMGNHNLLAGFNAVTGYDWTLEDLLVTGERAWVLKRVINNMMGVTSADDRLPKRVLTPVPAGPQEESVPDEALMKQEYYQVRGLDADGRPTAEKLDTLGLGFLKEKLFQT